MRQQEPHRPVRPAVPHLREDFRSTRLRPAPAAAAVGPIGGAARSERYPRQMDLGRREDTAQRTDAAAADWVPQACTLDAPALAERVQSLEDVLGREVCSVDPVSAQSLELGLRSSPQVAARVAELASQETSCCAFFSFELRIAYDQLALTVRVAPGHEGDLAALSARARELLAAR